MRMPIAGAAMLAAAAAFAQNSGTVQSTPPSSMVIPEKIEERPRPEARPRFEPPPISESAGLPDACRKAAAMAGYVDMPMDGGLPQPTQDALERMTGTQRALMQAMATMHAGMMQGMTAKDADVAWVCAMIPHHQGAIAMARAGLAGSDNAESRQLAEDTIRMQQDEIAKLTRWVTANAERESRNETGQAPKRQ